MKFLYERHCLAGCPSNHSQLDVMADFLEFVDLNSQPNGRAHWQLQCSVLLHSQVQSHCSTLTRRENFDQKAKASVVSEFNRAQVEQGRGTCGPTAAAEWLDKHRPKVVLHPSMTDYCDTCKSLKQELSRNQAVKNHLHQSDNASESDLSCKNNGMKFIPKRV